MPEEVDPVPNCWDGLPSPWVTPFSPDIGTVYYPTVVNDTEQKLWWGASRKVQHATIRRDRLSSSSEKPP